MKNIKFSRPFSNTISIELLKSVPITFGIFFILFMLMRFPEAAAQGVSDGIDLSFGTLIPTLFPFLVVSTLITETNITQKFSAPFARITNILFNLDVKCFGAVIMSMVGGMPIGCKMASELYENGSISLLQSKRLMLFCFCCGPAFTVSSVGIFILSSKSAGIVIYASLIVSAIIVGILSRFFEDKDNFHTAAFTSRENKVLSAALVKAVSSGTTAMLSICAWVILFSCINRLVEIMPFSDSAKFFAYCTLEVTNGAKISAGYLKIPLIAGIISFGGICSHCQVMPYLVKVKMKYKFFLVSRIINGALSVIVCNLLLEIFPVTYDVFSMGTLPESRAATSSVSISVAMMFLSGLFLLGDGTVIRLKEKKDHRS